MSPQKRWIRIIAGSLIAWLIVVTVAWAIRPLHDTVPVGRPAKDAAPATQEVACNSLFASRARDDVVLPALIAPLAYERGACTEVQREARIVFGIDVLVTLAGLAGVAVFARRSRRQQRASEVTDRGPQLQAV